jgi:toxin ParE1/3/4
MSQPFFSPSSRQDLREILEHIAKDKPGAALKHVVRLEEECWMLARNSELGSLRSDLLPNLRCWSVGNYVICYRRSNDGVEIIRVVHGARDIGRLFQQ